MIQVERKTGRRGERATERIALLLSSTLRIRMSALSADILMRKVELRLFQTILIACVVLAGCSRRDVETERRAAIASTLAGVRSCAPADGEAGEIDGKLKLAITSVAINPDETSVKMVAYTTDEAVDFDLPVYSLSRGRWVINEKSRAYLLDEHCREYKLRDKKSTSGQAIPQDGKIKLNPGQAFEVALSFPPLSEKTQMAILVYGGRRLFFTLWDKTP